MPIVLPSRWDVFTTDRGSPPTDADAYQQCNLASKRTDLFSAHLIAKFSFLSFVPFISSRIQIGVIPRPDHFTLGSFLD